MNITPYFKAWWDLLLADHWRLDSKFDHTWHKYETTDSGKVLYRTKRCGRRSCWACQHKQRRRLRNKISNFVETEVLPYRENWKFVTLTLPGAKYPVRDAGLKKQHQICSKAFRSWRAKMKYLDCPIDGVAVFEHVTNQRTNQWHTHIHMCIKWNWRIDYAIVKQKWTESVDRDTFRKLQKLGESTNNEYVFDIKPITDDGVGKYMTKVSNYLTKGPKVDNMHFEITQGLYRKRLTSWLGEYYGKQAQW